MKKVLLIILVLSVAAFAFADKGEMIKDGERTKVNGFAPNGKKEVLLTVNSQTVNMSDDIEWNVRATADCKFRTMSTVTKVGNAKTITSGTWGGRLVNPLTPYTNFSGCTAGTLERH